MIGRPTSTLRRFLGELRRRNVLRVGAAYLVAGWVILQVVDVLGPAVGAPDWVIVAVAVMVVAGLPVALAVAWFFEMTPAGLLPTAESPADESKTGQTGRRIDRIIIVLLAVALSGFVANYLFERFSGASRTPYGGARSLAVLAGPGTPGLGYQLALEVTRTLSALADLAVTPPEVAQNLRVRSPPAAAAEVLGVRFLLLFDIGHGEGEAEERATVSLYDRKVDAIAWSATHDPREFDALEFQRRVVEAVAQQLGASTPAEASALFAAPTESVEAYGLYLRGMQAFELSRYDAIEEVSEAESLLEEALTLDPQFALGHAGLCRLELARYAGTRVVAAFESAERHCHRALTLGRYNSEVHVALGDLYVASGQYERGEEAYREALAINPSQVSALLGLAGSMREQGDFASAEQFYRRAIHSQPAYYRPYSDLAYLYFTRRDPVNSRRNLELASQLAPANPRVLSDIGTDYVLAGDLQKAAVMFERALELDPRELNATSNLGTVYLLQERYDDAKALYEAAIGASPQDGTLWRNLGDVLFAQREKAAAERAFRRAIELIEQDLRINPTDSSVMSSLAVAYGSLGDGPNLDRVIAELERTRKLYPGTEYDMAVGLCRIGRLDECAGYAVRAIRGGFPEALIRADPDLEPIVPELGTRPGD